MPGLTVTEKEHWKDRISRRIDKRIEAISAVEPNLMDRVEREARERALASLGLAGLQREADDVEEQQKALKIREQEIERAMLARVRGIPAASIVGYVYQGVTEVENAVKRRQKVHEDELLAESDVGRRILALRAEKEELLDTVWLATSGTQIRALWQRVGALLGDQLTSLQSEALTIEPASDELSLVVRILLFSFSRRAPTHVLGARLVLFSGRSYANLLSIQFGFCRATRSTAGQPGAGPGGDRGNQ